MEEEHRKLKEQLEDYYESSQFRQKFKDWLDVPQTDSSRHSSWVHVDVAEASSDQSATKLIVQDDDSILAKGKTPTSEVYSVRVGVDPGVIRTLRSVRVEALTHPSMNRNGPGRASNGNFALSNFQIFLHPSDGSGPKGLAFASAKATHEQNDRNLSARSAIDDQHSATGWAVDFGGIGKDQAAVFQLASPIELSPDDELEFKMTFSNNAQHSLGRFRLSVSESSDAPVAVGGAVSQELADALVALDQGQLTEQQKSTLKPVFASTDSEWNRLNGLVKSSSDSKPKPTKVTVQVSSEGFPPTKHHADGRGFPHFYPETYFLNRGDPNQKEGVAEPSFLRVLMRNGKSLEHWQLSPPPNWSRTSFRRAALAQWITDTQDGAGHLLARVIANRVWHHHFGKGIVATPNDFGLQGARPSHPKLLDYLAQELIDNGWSIKHLHRVILRSATWSQSAASSEKMRKIDPENVWLWRFPSRRLEGEVIRDSMLSVASQLDTKMYGPGTLNPKHRRRSIYFMIKRSRLISMMQIFDQPEPLSSQGSRPSTTIAPQALMFMNNPQVVGWARSFASSVQDLDTREAIEEIYQRALGRLPSPLELEENLSFVADQAASYSDIDQAKALALADVCQVVFSLNEFVYLP